MSMSATTPVRLSEKQEAFIRVLLDEREVPDEKRQIIGDPHTLERQAASRVIEYLTGLPKKPGVLAHQWVSQISAGVGATVTPHQPQAPVVPAAPNYPAIAPPTITAEGMYQIGQDIYRVQRSRRTRHLFAELLTPNGGFAYARGKVYDLKPEHRMTVEQAKAYGIKWGRCCVCGKTLTDPASMAQGIGPVCIKGKYFTGMTVSAGPAVGASVTP